MLLCMGRNIKKKQCLHCARIPKTPEEEEGGVLTPAFYCYPCKNFVQKENRNDVPKCR